MRCARLFVKPVRKVYEELVRHVLKADAIVSVIVFDFEHNYYIVTYAHSLVNWCYTNPVNLMRSKEITMPRGQMKDFGKKNKGGKKDYPTALPTPKAAVRRLKRKKPEQR